jgi:hypothetical protein
VDGTIISEMPDRSKTTLTPVAGSTPDKPLGYTRIETTFWGETTTTQPDGTKVLKSLGEHTTTTQPDGTIISKDADTGRTVTQNPDGTRVIKESDGRITTRGKDGDEVTVYPNGDTETCCGGGLAITKKN